MHHALHHRRGWRSDAHARPSGRPRTRLAGRQAPKAFSMMSIRPDPSTSATSKRISRILPAGFAGKIFARRRARSGPSGARDSRSAALAWSAALLDLDEDEAVAFARHQIDLAALRRASGCAAIGLPAATIMLGDLILRRAGMPGGRPRAAAIGMPPSAAPLRSFLALQFQRRPDRHARRGRPSASATSAAASLTDIAASRLVQCRLDFRHRRAPPAARDRRAARSRPCSGRRAKPRPAVRPGWPALTSSKRLVSSRHSAACRSSPEYWRQIR